MGSQGFDVSKFLDRDVHDIGVRFPDLEVFVPCTAPSGSLGKTSEQCCRLIEWMPIWNRVLAHFGLQLQELTAPGELSLVRIAHVGDQQEVRGRDARLLVHVLLSQHRCVVGIHLDDALVEGCGLLEWRDRVIITLWRNCSVRSLILGSLFHDYKFIQEELFSAIGLTTNLQRLEITASGEVTPRLVDSLCVLLYTGCLSTLSIPGLSFDEEATERLLDALQTNTTLLDLSLPGSVLRCRNSADVPKLCSYLASKASLWHLAIIGTHSKPEQMRQAIACVLAVLAASGNLQTLRLSGFLLDGDCACALSRLVARHDGPLQQLDVSGCQWTSGDSPASVDTATDCDQPDASPADTAAHLWLAPFDDFTLVTLASLSINLEGCKPDDYTALFIVAAVIESLKRITVTGVSLSELPRVCRAIREAGAGEKVRIKNEYLLDLKKLGTLDHCREQIGELILSWRSDPSVDSFCKSVQIVSSWRHLNTLRLFLSQEALDDVSTSWSLSSYIRAATRLRELELAGCDNPHLGDSLVAEDGPHSLILDAAFSNEGLRVLRIGGIRLGEVNVRFLVGAVLSNETLREVEVCSGDEGENEELLRLLAADFETNRTLLKCVLPECAARHTEAWTRASIEAVISRNVGYVTCAAQFVAWEKDPTRCSVALSCIPKSRALIDRVQELAHVGEAEAKKLILSRSSQGRTI
ncbi:uncharacterized protein LOC119179676 [Rhipicephalus microplus]|uniref:uncharacterized protein LOC119179676 n=1 Tax=Rhipicephalus microplus TaxID=6941 RepID=UPI003F6B3376